MTVAADRKPGDDDVRQRLLNDLDSTFVVEAAAGTGKTTVLVERIVMLVRKGKARLEQIISVTFTEKAAGEMKLRLRTKLERSRDEVKDPAERDRLTTALEELEVARIGTIHGLCADLLREYPVEAGVDPLFEVAAEGDAEAVPTAMRDLDPGGVVVAREESYLDLGGRDGVAADVPGVGQ